MKVVLTNPPVVRPLNSSAHSDFHGSGFVCPRFLAIMPGSFRLMKLLRQKFRLGKGVRYGIRAGSRWPFTSDFPICNSSPFPFFMAYAASYLRSNGIEAEVVDAVVEGETSYEKYIEKIKRHKADIVILETSTPTFDIDIWIAHRITDFSDVALAGPHVSIKAEEILAQEKKIKYILKGEYILNSLKMAQTQKPGIYDYEIVEDLDSLPFPLRDYHRADKYFEPTMPTPKPQLQIYGSKGCPFKCSFCYWPHTMYKGKYTGREPEKIIQEIKEAIAMHQYKSILFDDDTFNIGTERISRLCDMLKELNLPWTMMGRLDCSPAWLYDKMVDSGCVGMRFGVETFNLDCLKRINKGLERVDFISTLKYLSDKYPEVMIHLTMMKNMPEQTQKIHEEDIKQLHDLGYSSGLENIMRSYQLSQCAPFPGTKMYDDLVEEYGEANLSNYKSYDGSIDTVMTQLKKNKP